MKHYSHELFPTFVPPRRHGLTKRGGEIYGVRGDQIWNSTRSHNWRILGHLRGLAACLTERYNPDHRSVFLVSECVKQRSLRQSKNATAPVPNEGYYHS